MKNDIVGFEHLHRHSDLSLLDGLAKVREYAEYSAEVNQKYLAITDHGVMGAIPSQVAIADQYKLKPIFGCEMYINPLQPKVNSRYESADFRKQLDEKIRPVFDKPGYHLLALAYNFQGYQNIVRMTSWAWIHGFYKKPRINHEILKEHKEGIIFTSTCANSEIAQAFLRNQDDAEGFAMLEKYLELVGKDHFYLELMMLDYKMQKPYDAFLIRAHDKYGLPLILTQDCLVEGSMVVTQRGLQPIENIVPGDFVWTHKNRWKEVEVVGKRPVKEGEKVYRVALETTQYAYEATGNHKVRIARKHNDLWTFDWVETKDLTPKKDYLLYSIMPKSEIFSQNNLCFFDLLNVIPNSQNDTKGNMGSKLQYDNQKQEFTSYKGWDHQKKTTIPRFLPIDDELLEIIGRFIGDGWSEKGSNQVGFAFNIEEKLEAKKIMQYFSKFGISSKIYKVSSNGIAVRFSSIVFNKFFGNLCGYGAKNKHLPYFDLSQPWKHLTEKQMGKVFQGYWKADGGFRKGKCYFGSVSRKLLREITTVTNTLGIIGNFVSIRSKPKKENQNTCWSIDLPKMQSIILRSWMLGVEIDANFNKSYFDSYWEKIDEETLAVRVKDLKEIDYKSDVFDIQVDEDHSFVCESIQISNCHYCKKEHSQYQQIMLMQNNKKTLADIEALIASGEEDIFELQDTNLYMKSEEELNYMWNNSYSQIIDYELFKQAKMNTVKICEKACNVELDRKIKLPEFDKANKKLMESIMQGYEARKVPKTKKYIERIKEEYNLICKKGFASYFLIEQQMTGAARAKSPEIMGWGDGFEAVGPGRGSVVGSLVAYCLDLHDVDPVEHDLLFSRFLSPARGGKQAKLRFSGEPIQPIVSSLDI